MKTRKPALKLIQRTRFTYARPARSATETTTDPTTSTITTSTITGGIFAKQDPN